MKITLISLFPDLKAFGVRCLSACLKARGHFVQIIFLPKHFTSRYDQGTLTEVAKLSKESDLIGVSLTTNFFENAIQITRALKKDGGVPIAWGGVHPTIRPEECLKYADIVCIGEGEETLVELADSLSDGRNYYGIQGIWFNDKNQIIRNPNRRLIQDLNILPFQDYDYEGHYVLSDGAVRKMDASVLDADLLGAYTTMPTRGCPFGCTYCCNFTFNKMNPGQNPVRKRTADNIIKELAERKNKFPFIKKITFIDDAFLIYSDKEIEDFCRQYKENVGLPFSIDGGATPSTLNRNKLSFLVDAGLVSLKMGIQTASERIKRLYNRHHTNQQVEIAVNLINEFKDRIRMPHYDILLDNPWETEEELSQTLMFLSRFPGPFQLNTYSLTFYPGTGLYELAKTEGKLADELQSIYSKDYYFYSCKKTYLNKLFFLLNEYAFYGARIPPKTMSWLTNSTARRLKISRLIYAFLKINSLLLKKKRLKIILAEGLKDIKKKDWVTIRRKFSRWI
ncbi:MAG: radical SAM protein [Candidatus Omnitrophota bacterium]|nr:radical SAM protein [Candidatus Omnitrophota bacterium]